MVRAGALTALIDELERLPGIGPKSAQRIAFWILNTDRERVFKLSDAIRHAKESLHFCERCFNYAEDDQCAICSDGSRDETMLCVVSEPRDIGAIEATGAFEGVYHVLGGALSPLDGIGPDDLHIAELMDRLAREPVTEVIIATNPNIEGETTAAYLARLIKPLAITVTKPASGLPVGGDLEYADEVTLSRAFEARRPL